jgi:hypothetical protein
VISSGLTRWSADVYKASTSIDSLGRRVTTYAKGASFRCDLREETPSEQVYADGVAVIQQFEVRTRWPNIARTTLTALDRLVVRGRTLRILGIRNLEQRDRLAVIDAVEVA